METLKQLPRVVVVTRKTPLEQLIERFGTAGQARFYVEDKGRKWADYERIQARFDLAVKTVMGAIPAAQQRLRLDRGDLDRFIFRDDDIIVIVGQDGLVPNVAKYLHGQIVIGINSDPEMFDGVLCRHAPALTERLLKWCSDPGKDFTFEQRVMAQAVREDGQRLLALNEFYFGSRTHQSSKYTLRIGGKSERQSSSGVIVSTGTGATGWGRSVAQQRKCEEILPKPEEAKLAWFVREPFPSVSTGITLDHGALVSGQVLEATSELGDNGVIFADGIESDTLEFIDSQTVKISVAPELLKLVIPASKITS
jgi:NAD kinase